MSTETRDERWRHSRHLSNLAVYLFLAATTVLPWLPTPPRVVTALVTTSAVGMMLVSMRHTRELCERCITRVPLDPAAAVERSATILRAVHNLRWLVAPIAVFLAAGMALPQHSWGSNLADSLATCMCLIVTLCAARHRVLQPWCPFCHRGDGGSGETSEVPDPSDGKRKPVPA